MGCRARILNLDDGFELQENLLQRCQAPPGADCMRSWGARVRLACGHSEFEIFAADLLRSPPNTDGPEVHYIGSGDFHHVTYALLRRMTQPINLLVLDAHPDWMRGLPFLHCGTWLHHAARMPHVRRIFLVGGTTDFDNRYQPLTPWRLLETNKITLIPAVRRFTRGRWKRIDHQPLRTGMASVVEPSRLERILAHYDSDIRSLPLYASVDTDVLLASECTVTWDSGQLLLSELVQVLDFFLDRTRLAGADVVGNWSRVHLRGWSRKAMALVEHPRLNIDPVAAAERNERVHLTLLDHFAGLHRSLPPAASVLAAEPCPQSNLV